MTSPHACQCSGSTPIPHSLHQLCCLSLCCVLEPKSFFSYLELSLVIQVHPSRLMGQSSWQVWAPKPGLWPPRVLSFLCSQVSVNLLKGMQVMLLWEAISCSLLERIHVLKRAERISELQMTRPARNWCNRHLCNASFCSLGNWGLEAKNLIQGLGHLENSNWNRPLSRWPSEFFKK